MSGTSKKKKAGTFIPHIPSAKSSIKSTKVGTFIPHTSPKKSSIKSTSQNNSDNTVPSWINEDTIYDDGDQWKKLCADSKTSDFLFRVSEEDCGFGTCVAVTICPRQYFEKYGYMLDKTPEIRHLLPSYIGGELEEAILEVEEGYTVDQVRQELLKLGFIESGAFSAFVQSTR